MNEWKTLFRNWKGAQKNLEMCQKKSQRILIPRKWTTDCGVVMPCCRNFLWALWGARHDPLSLQSSVKEVIRAACSMDCCFSWPQGRNQWKTWDTQTQKPKENLALSLECSLEIIKLSLYPLQIRTTSTLAYRNKSSENPLTPRHTPTPPTPPTFNCIIPLYLFLFKTIKSSGLPGCLPSPLAHLLYICPCSPYSSLVIPPLVSDQHFNPLMPSLSDELSLLPLSLYCEALPRKLSDNSNLSSVCTDWSHLVLRL